MASDTPPGGPLVKKLSISKIAREFGLSRSTLLYYDRIGLLPPSGRTGSGYRYYTDGDADRLERIRTYRQAGLTLIEIRGILDSPGEPPAGVFENRLRELGGELRELRSKQRLLRGMLKKLTTTGGPVAVDKALWVEMLRAAGMNDAAMSRTVCGSKSSPSAAT